MSKHDTRTELERRSQDRWQDPKTGWTHFHPNPATDRIRVLPWPRRGVDGVPEYAPEPPVMDEVWPGRVMQGPKNTVILTGAPPVWCTYNQEWRVTVKDDGYVLVVMSWEDIKPIRTKTTITITTDDPEAVREALRTLKGVEVEG